MADRKERITLFLVNMLTTIHNSCTDKTCALQLNNHLKEDVMMFISNIKQEKEKIDLEKNIRLIDIKETDSIKDKLFEYRSFFINLVPGNIYRKYIINHINNILLIII